MKKIALMMVTFAIAATGAFAATPRHQEGPKQHKEATDKKSTEKKHPAKTKKATSTAKKKPMKADKDAAAKQ